MATLTIDSRPYAVQGFDSARERAQYLEAERMASATGQRADDWLTACGGFEVPVIRNGEWQLYVWNPAQHAHGWYRYSTDTVEEVTAG